MPLRILIVDDHGLLRAGLRAILEDEADFEVVGEAGDGDEALELARAATPNLVLMDLGLPGMGGIEATRRMKAMHPGINVLILTVYEDESFLREAIKAGASGYVIKRAAEEDLIRAIHAVQRGDMYVHPAMTRKLLQDLSPSVETKRSAVHLLTPRELEIMRYIIRGYTSRQIAEALFISARTVEGHRASLMSKLDLKNRVELVEFAQKNGLFE
jgi:DNA-binding NarL/FixJ family response regulator